VLIVVKLARFEVVTVVKIKVEVFWVVMPCSVAVLYHLHPEGPLKHWYPTTTLLCHNAEYLDLNFSWRFHYSPSSETK
jgi:hypothetical protein